jgi:hypothetical protein
MQVSNTRGGYTGIYYKEREEINIIYLDLDRLHLTYDLLNIRGHP